LSDVDGREFAQTLEELTKSRLDELLALQGGLVFTVLAEVTHLDGSADLVWQGDVQLVLQSGCLVGQLLLECFDHGSWGCDDKYGAPGLVSRALSVECMSDSLKTQIALPPRR
jgi:hypothetical protein